MARFNVARNQIAQAVQANKPSMPGSFEKYFIAVDRDGVLCEISDVIKKTEDFLPIDGSINAIAKIRSKGHKLAVIFDQPAIGKNKLTMQDVDVVNQHMLNLFGQAGCTSIDGLWYNMSDKKDDPFAKPNTGMFKRALETDPRLEIKGGIYVGDSIEDLQMADKAGATPILVLTGNGKKTLEKLENHLYKKLKEKVKIFDNLMAFAESLD